MAPAAASANPIQITDHYDSGITPPFSIDGHTITFDFRAITFPYLDCVLQSPPGEVTVRLRLNARGTLFYGKQGLYISADGDTFSLQPLTKLGETARTVEAKGKAEKVIDTDFETVVAIGPSGRTRIAVSDPYGRDHLEALVAETAGGAGRWRSLRRSNRTVLLYEIGTDDGRKPVHYFIAGEDSRETEAQWVADRMIRRLAAGREADAALVRDSVIRICPVLSPYTISHRGHNSYASPVDGRDTYGASKWSLNSAPPEFEILREMLVTTIREQRLGFALTLHSWWAGKTVTEIETLRRAGENTLDPAREAWALATMRTLMHGVPHANVVLAEKAWFPGIMREFTLARHNAITFRIEVTTRDQPTPRGAATADALLSNLPAIADWRPAAR